MKPTTLINGQAYSFVDVTFDIVGLTNLANFNGTPIKSISYNSEQQKAMNYENSKFATSLSYGKMTFSGNVTFTLDSAEMLRDAIFLATVRERSIVACPPCEINITFSNRGKLNTTTLHNVVFTTENMSASEGDDTIQVTCDFICSYIDFGGIRGKVELATLANNLADSINSEDNQGI